MVAAADQDDPEARLPVLYSCGGSRGLRASWAAAEADLRPGRDFTLRMMPFPPRFEEVEFLEINPLGTVPCLVQGDVVMTESCAIALYLAGLRGDALSGSLIVKPGEADYAHFLDFTYHADATLTFPQTVFLRFAQFEKHKGFEEAGQAYAKWFEKRLIKVDRRLKQREFLCADRFTVADICVGYALYLAQKIGLGDRLPPSLNAYWDRLQARDGFQMAMEAERVACEAAGLKAAL